MPGAPTRRLLGLLAASAAWSGVDGQGAQCAPGADGNPCIFECPGTTIHRVDLRALKQSAPTRYVDTTDESGKRYFFGACGAVHGVTCEGVPPPAGPTAAIQSWGGDPPAIQGTCAFLGMTASANCTLVPATRTGLGAGMRCRYTGGSEGRSVDIHYDCTSTTGSRAEETASNKYVITVSGPNVCAVVYTPPLSWGSMTLIFFCVGVVLYVGGGAGYNIKVREARPTLRDAFPQWHYWKQVPGLVKDGCAFSYETGQKLYYEKVLGASAPLETDLKRRLAESAIDSASGGGGDANT